jgi:N-acetylmuramoyl-L-alanine amidase
MSVERSIVIDPGHGGKDPGAAYSSLDEKIVVLLICLDLVTKLEALNNNYHTFLTRSIDMFVSLGRRSEFSNRVKADLFISVHCNADPDLDLPGTPEAKGEEIWISPRNAKSKILAKGLAMFIDLIFPSEPFRGVKESVHLSVLNHVEAPACLIEVGFIDKSSSIETFSNMETLHKISQLIARGIDQYFILR